METKHVTLCADDFGLHGNVDDAVIDLFNQGRLSATSCLVQGGSFRANASALLATGLQRGLHLNFTEPLPGVTLCLPLHRLIRECWWGRLDPVGVKDTIRRQLDCFEDVFDGPPDYVDGHQHVHQFPQIREALLDELGQRYPADTCRRPWIRCTIARAQAGVPLSIRLKAAVIAALGAREARRQMVSKHFEMNRAFLGVYGFSGGVDAYLSLLRRWLIAAHDGDVIMSHPATRPVPGDPLGEQRQAEFQAWGSSQVGEWMEALMVVPAYGRKKEPATGQRQPV